MQGTPANPNKEKPEQSMSGGMMPTQMMPTSGGGTANPEPNPAKEETPKTSEPSMSGGMMPTQMMSTSGDGTANPEPNSAKEEPPKSSEPSMNEQIEERPSSTEDDLMNPPSDDDQLGDAESLLNPKTSQPEESTSEPATTTSEDPIIGPAISSTSNDNLIAILSTLDFSRNTTITSISSSIETDNRATTIAYSNTTNTTTNFVDCTNPITSQFNPASGNMNELEPPKASAEIEQEQLTIRFESARYFKNRGIRKVDRITNFSPSDGDIIEISSRFFDVEGRLTLASVSTRRGRKRAAKTSTDFIYQQTNGQLYFNGNGETKGFGRNGGLFAIFESTPILGLDQFQLN